MRPTISLEMPVPSQSHYGFHSFPWLTDFVCLYTYEFWLSLCKIVRSSEILLLPLYIIYITIGENTLSRLHHYLLNTNVVLWWMSARISAHNVIVFFVIILCLLNDYFINSFNKSYNCSYGDFFLINVFLLDYCNINSFTKHLKAVKSFIFDMLA